MTDEISIEEAKRLIEKGATVVDVREPEKFDRGRVPDSISIPMDELTANLPKLEGKEPLVMVCELGEASRQAGMLLEAYGGVESDEIYNLREGLLEWDGDWEGEPPEPEKNESHA